jgi:hypothetical protein
MITVHFLSQTLREPDPVQMASAGLLLSLPIQNGRAYSSNVSGCIVEMEDDFTLSIFVSGGWADSINFVKNITAEIFSIKTMSF